MMKIMIVEDDETVRELISESLQNWGFETIEVTDFKKVLDVFQQEEPHLVLLDITLPVFDGYYWVQKIREVSKAPVIFISSRDTNADSIMSMNMGGDDYVTKPFATDILIAKVNALLRRTYDYSKASSSTLEHNGLTLNMENSSLVIDDTTVELSKNEFQLLLILLKNKGKIVSREKLLRALWDDERFVDDNTLTVNINRLRKKIEGAGIAGYIETKVGQGYIIP
ncbi:response regulator transcription factor [Vagococcus sp. DIV0080]|uniref:Response regulator transcription factor n=1 Tax=Candidatus Vagococcus giribetii TaxID=2230876 RepID=A0ABS3HNW0_9ENTE|nr:response regulator transcription factor [Vagococcus sp. DIV0080]MBO0475439.1 response regulator transcription factor [Vagococcus sp. DIV0080]